MAAAPQNGEVVEGVSVPGIALGDSRAQVEAAYGDPESCQNLPYYYGPPHGLNGICKFDVDGVNNLGDQVTVYYFDANGGPAQDSPDDVVFSISWQQVVSGWTTTAGVNTTLALTNPEAVIAAYPNGLVTHNMFGSILQVKDYELGIQVNWAYNFYSGTTSVSMAISAPSVPPPPREKLTQVDGIELTASKAKGQRKVIALVKVEDDRTLAASEAAVFATWILPDGTVLEVEDLTSGSGYAYFEIRGASRGTHTLVIQDVILADHRFDAGNSVLSASIKVK